MSPSERRPTFLSHLPAGDELRPVRFATAHAPVRVARPGPPRGPGEARHPGPVPAELAALRAQSLEKVAHAVEVLRLQAVRLAEQARSDALEIGFEVARRILEAEVRADPAAVIALVRSAVQRAGESRRIVVRLHPEDVDVVAADAESGGGGIATARIEVLADATLERGDVLVDADFGRVDGRLSTRLDELRRAAAAAEDAA